MVTIERLRAANASFFRQRSLVGVFVGGTSGLGEYSIRALAKLYGGEKQLGLRVYVVGRSSSAASKIIADCSRICPRGIFTFVQADDLASLPEVDRISAKVLALEQEHHQNDTPRIDLLLMTQGRVLFGPRQGQYPNISTWVSCSRSQAATNKRLTQKPKKDSIAPCRSFTTHASDSSLS